MTVSGLLEGRQWVEADLRNVHTGQRCYGSAEQAGQMAASNYATVTSSHPLLR